LLPAGHRTGRFGAPAVDHRPLGNSSLTVSPIALGTWSMSGAAESWGHVDDNESIAAIQQALDSGINFFDTAPIYGLGHSETLLGRALRGRREEAIVATKCGVLFPDRRDEPPARSLAYRSVIAECDASLRRLRMEVIDLYQCHWPDPETPIGDTMEALTSLLRQGKIRAIGLSNFSVEQIAEARQHGPVHCVQPPFSIIQPRATEELIPYCERHGIGVIGYSPLAKGLLTGKFAADSVIEGVRARDPEFLGHRFQRNLRIVEGLRPLAARLGRSLAQLALNWVAYHPGVSAAICGAKRPSQVIDNAGATGWQLTPADREEIQRVMRGDTLDPE
jgi:aryl-alcohol dehydrogenase-like predicted oxidoreductase